MSALRHLGSAVDGFGFSEVWLSVGEGELVALGESLTLAESVGSAAVDSVPSSPLGHNHHTTATMTTITPSSISLRTQ
jgi:hypothetical protein